MFAVLVPVLFHRPVLLTGSLPSLSQAVGYGLVLLDGNVVNINKLQKKLVLSRIDRLFRVRSTTDTALQASLQHAVYSKI